MNIVSLQEIKDHLRIDGNAEDALLTLYGESAEDLTIQYLNTTLEDLVADLPAVPKAIKHAVLLLVAHSYQNREAVSERNMYAVPYGYDALIKPYMIL